MPYITVEKKTELTSTSIIKTGAAGSRLCSVTAGLSRRMIGTRRCFFSSAKVSASLRLIGADMVARLKPATDTTWDHYADDLKAVTDHLNLKDAIHVGHSTGGGQLMTPNGERASLTASSLRNWSTKASGKSLRVCTTYEEPNPSRNQRK